MICHHAFFRRCIAACCALAFHATLGHACTATLPDVYSVGNKTVDSSCDYAKIQDAIDDATCPAGTKIILNQSGDYSDQHLTITDKNITLVGRVNTSKCNTLVAACGVTIPCPVGPLRTIDGNSGAVITVRGASSLTLSHLTISGGHGDNGGGIDFAAAYDLKIDNSTISDNRANNGAGIRFAPTQPATLTLADHVFIQNNIAAYTGGGIRADGPNADVVINAQPIWIQGNQAGDNGGGLAAVGGATAHIGSPGYLFGGVIYGNTANYGGGIAIIAESTGSPGVQIFASDPIRPVRVEHNRAYFSGGGIYLVPYFGFPSNSQIADVQIGGGQVDANVAKEGSAIYAEGNTFGTKSIVTFYAHHCAAGVVCNSMSNNQAQDIANGYAPTTGSTLLLQTDTNFEAHELTMRGNGVDPGGPQQNANVIRVVDTLVNGAILDTCLIADNAVTGELITFGQAGASVSQCTFTHNAIGGAAVVRAQGAFSMTNSIIAQDALPAIAYSGSGLTLDYLLLPAVAPTPSGTHIFKDDPQFIDPAHGDYHLDPGSPAVDVAPAGDAGERDIENRPRDVDLPGLTNINGPRDLGAYERQLDACYASDTVFCNGFEAL